MCHPEVPAGAPLPKVHAEDVAVEVGDGARMPALLALPERTPASAVLVINDVFGRSEFYEHLTRRLAQAGFIALDPEFFVREGPLPEPTREAAMARRPTLNEKRTLADLGAAIDWLRGRRVASGKVGTIGFCMGATFVLNLAAERGDLAASVSYYGFPASSTHDPPPPPDGADRLQGPILRHPGGPDSGSGICIEATRSAELQRRGLCH